VIPQFNEPLLIPLREGVGLRFDLSDGEFKKLGGSDNGIFATIHVVNQTRTPISGDVVVQITGDELMVYAMVQIGEQTFIMKETRNAGRLSAVKAACIAPAQACTGSSYYEDGMCVAQSFFYCESSSPN